jgi:hypothetical protein
VHTKCTPRHPCSPPGPHTRSSRTSQKCVSEMCSPILSAAPPEQACALHLKGAHTRAGKQPHAKHLTAPRVQVCQKSATARKHCFPKGPGRKAHWLKKTCPTMSCRCVKRDLAQCQKKPISVSKETYYSVKRELLQCQKRPVTVSKEMSCRCVPQCVSLNILGLRSVSSFFSQRHVHMCLYVFICF